jgi:hypothetical protein
MTVTLTSRFLWLSRKNRPRSEAERGWPRAGTVSAPIEKKSPVPPGMKFPSPPGTFSPPTDRVGPTVTQRVVPSQVRAHCECRVTLPGASRPAGSRKIATILHPITPNADPESRVSTFLETTRKYSVVPRSGPRPGGEVVSALWAFGKTREGGLMCGPGSRACAALRPGL